MVISGSFGNDDDRTGHQCRVGRADTGFVTLLGKRLRQRRDTTTLDKGKHMTKLGKVLGPALIAFAAFHATTAAARNYDCSKAGNANKAVCKDAATATPAPVAATSAPTASTTTTMARHYDCTKAGNANKAVCKNATSAAAPAAPAPAAMPAPGGTGRHNSSPLRLQQSRQRQQGRVQGRHPRPVPSRRSRRLRPLPLPRARPQLP